MQFSRFHRIYTLGIVIRKGSDSLELFFSDKTGFDQFYVDRKFQATSAETRAFISLLRPTQILIELYYDEMDKLRQVVEFIESVECAFFAGF
jgi:hypothetical protein